MVKVIIDDGGMNNEVFDLVRAFFPGEDVQPVKRDSVDENGDSSDYAGSSDNAESLLIDCRYEQAGQGCFLFYARIMKEGRLLQEVSTEANQGACSGLALKRHIKNNLKACAYRLLSEYTDKKLPWGILTGIRPTKIVHRMMDEGANLEEACESLRKDYLVAPDKAALLKDIARIQRPHLAGGEKPAVSLYIHIPFCTTRCLYCSFPSELIERAEPRMGEYLDCLERELKEGIELLEGRGMIVDNVYIGGGTPTALSYPNFERLLKFVHGILSGHPVEEYTVEAGRPDTIDREKLDAMRCFGVNRISINPQTMNRDTLERIGRAHAPEDVERAFQQAREAGFDRINTDIIIGLPGEDVLAVERTLEGIGAMGPDNLTVHTLAVKRASVLFESKGRSMLPEEGAAEAMADLCRTWAYEKGFVPYYLYRQKNMLDNLENVGYTRPGKECLFNIHTMEERRSIWAFGAGAISKVYYSAEDRLERLVNVKNLGEYIGRIGEMIDKKKKVLAGS